MFGLFTSVISVCWSLSIHASLVMSFGSTTPWSSGKGFSVLPTSATKADLTRPSCVFSSSTTDPAPTSKPLTIPSSPNIHIPSLWGLVITMGSENLSCGDIELKLETIMFRLMVTFVWKDSLSVASLLAAAIFAATSVSSTPMRSAIVGTLKVINLI
ncbi:hypothetical protein OGATHE_003357 [Ogataea polymorpha]|uniref:Secreted protein n=1 Tax=Ogataea polymorpha TaxID=460523 RepID=A0A9P8P465_9ASCO|nr:hypothetical protein OGATHE_003357 [Ogataea polymorpha]